MEHLFYKQKIEAERIVKLNNTKRKNGKKKLNRNVKKKIYALSGC